LVMSGHEKDVRNTVCAAGIVAIGLALFLIQLWGAMGAAAAIAVTMTAQNLVLAYFVKMRLGINMFRLRESGQAV
jgi:O-antigen/teichoic acid export membrane protein